MRGGVQRRGQRGQAAVEGLLALTLLGALWYGVTAVGTLSMHGQQAGHLSRLAAFTGAELDAMAHRGVTASISMETLSLPSETSVGFTEQSCIENIDHAGTKTCTGDTHAVRLQRDWLQEGSRIRRAHATVHSLADPMQIKRDGALSLLSITRQTAIAPITGYEKNDSTISHRIESSIVGWKRAADLSRPIAQRVIQRMRSVDTAVDRGSVSTNWVSAWSVLPLRK